jgi:LuxR family transcriptional regulator, maltose regulon positive regulatory protein
MMTMILLSGLTDKSKQILEILESAQGWPAAVQLIIRGAAKGVGFKISAAQIASSVDPLRLVVAEFVRSLPLEEKAILLPLSIVGRFHSLSWRKRSSERVIPRAH